MATQLEYFVPAQDGQSLLKSLVSTEFVLAEETDTDNGYRAVTTTGVVFEVEADGLTTENPDSATYKLSIYDPQGSLVLRFSGFATETEPTTADLDQHIILSSADDLYQTNIFNLLLEQLEFFSGVGQNSYIDGGAGTDTLVDYTWGSSALKLTLHQDNTYWATFSPTGETTELRNFEFIDVADLPVMTLDEYITETADIVYETSPNDDSADPVEGVLEGTYQGNYSGDETGKFTLVVDGISISGWWYDPLDNEVGAVLGSISPGTGVFQAYSTDSDGAFIGISGTASGDSISGSWTLDFTQTGTFAGTTEATTEPEQPIDPPTTDPEDPTDTPTEDNDTATSPEGTENPDQLEGSEDDDLIYGYAGDDTIYGRGGGDTLFGGEGNDQLYGEAGDDIIDGGTGDDLMFGGYGNDTYYVDSAADEVVEDNNEAYSPEQADSGAFPAEPSAGTNIDQVFASIDFVLSEYVENLSLTEAALEATGNELDNEIAGNELNNTLFGMAGEDILMGGLGDDFLNGGEADDIAFYLGITEDYYIFTNPENSAQTIVIDLNKEDGDDGRDVLENIEYLTFLGETLTVEEVLATPDLVDDDQYYWDAQLRLPNGDLISSQEAQLYRTYFEVLQRTPDDVGYNWWLTEIEAGRQDLKSMAAGFLWSDEFLGYVNAPDGNSIENEAFLTHMYHGVFGRAPDGEGYNWWLSELESGNRTQVDVLVDMTQSNEYVQLTKVGTTDYLYGVYEFA